MCSKEHRSAAPVNSLQMEEQSAASSISELAQTASTFVARQVLAVFFSW